MSCRALWAVLALCVLAFIAAHPARADATKGAQIARQWCANCHVIGGNSTAAVPQGPPTFSAIARSGMASDHLRAFLSHPLTRAEIDDLIGYIETFR